MKNDLLQPGSQRSVCQRVGLKERVDCATLPFTETSSVEGETKSFEDKDSIKSFFPRNVSLHYSLFSGTVVRSCFLRRTLEPTQRRWTVRTSSSESLDRGFASSLGTLTFSMGEPSKDTNSYFFFSLIWTTWGQRLQYSWFSLQSHTSKQFCHMS